MSKAPKFWDNPYTPEIRYAREFGSDVVYTIDYTIPLVVLQHVTPVLLGGRATLPKLALDLILTGKTTSSCGTLHALTELKFYVASINPKSCGAALRVMGYDLDDDTGCPVRVTNPVASLVGMYQSSIRAILAVLPPPDVYGPLPIDDRGNITATAQGAF